VGLAKAEILRFSLAYDANGAGSSFQSGPGIDVTLPIFNQNEGGRAVAHARVVKAVRDAVAVRDRIAGEVRQARTRVAAARAVASGWESALPELEKALDRARSAVELGNSPQLVALDAARRLVEARSKATETTARLREAWAELEYAVGHRL
jgi:cobalt-zinc-cadmium efflux system outer membrane protein